jgi:hypothetical protein
MNVQFAKIPEEKKYPGFDYTPGYTLEDLASDLVFNGALWRFLENPPFIENDEMEEIKEFLEFEGYIQVPDGVIRREDW